MSAKPLYPKRLYFSGHALGRCKERGFTVEDVKRILYLGAVAESSFQPKGGPVRYARSLAFGTRVAKVIFTDWPDRYDIVTVEWVGE